MREMIEVSLRCLNQRFCVTNYYLHYTVFMNVIKTLRYNDLLHDRRIGEFLNQIGSSQTWKDCAPNDSECNAREI
ncbi:unnamed protein product [Arabidopsis halleri]